MPPCCGIFDITELGRLETIKVMNAIINLITQQEHYTRTVSLVLKSKMNLIPNSHITTDALKGRISGHSSRVYYISQN